MKDLFILWIIFQLALFGAVTVDIKNSMVRGNLDLCSPGKEESRLFGAFVPVAIYMALTTDIGLKEYCATHLQESSNTPHHD